MKIYPLPNVKPVFSSKNQTFQDLGIRINPVLEGTRTEDILQEKTATGEKSLISLEFNWLPNPVVKAYNNAKTEAEKKKILVERVYSNCILNCKGCYVKKDSLFQDRSLLYPEQVLTLIEEAVRNLGTRVLKYLGPSEFFRDKDVFDYLDRLKKLDVVLNIFAKDPMFGDDNEVAKLFSHLGLYTSEELVKSLAEKYPNLRILYNFRSFDKEITNDLVRDGYPTKKNYPGNYKAVQTRSVQLLYKYFVQNEIRNRKEPRLVILNTPITEETTGEAFEIFQYFIDRGMLVCSTSTMQSGCGIELKTSPDFVKKLISFYAKAMAYSTKRGLLPRGYFEKYGPSPYAGIGHCIQLCNGLLIRETGQLMRCPGADHTEWQDLVTPEELIKEGIVNTWRKTRNFQENSKINIRCLAKPEIFTTEFNRQVMETYLKIKSP